jgi:hypothetical protein
MSLMADGVCPGRAGPARRSEARCPGGQREASSRALRTASATAGTLRARLTAPANSLPDILPMAAAGSPADPRGGGRSTGLAGSAAGSAGPWAGVSSSAETPMPPFCAVRTAVRERRAPGPAGLLRK